MQQQPQQSPQIDAQAVIADINAGLLNEQLGHAIKESALAALVHHGKAKVTLELTFAPVLNDGRQVNVGATLKYQKPTSRGHMSEVGKTDTPMFVTADGQLSAVPQTLDMFRDQRKQAEGVTP